MKLKDIVIPKLFLDSPPKEEKIKEVTDYYKKHGKLDKPIIIDKNGTLVDGYVRYLVANNEGLEDPLILYTTDKRLYIKAVHSSNRNAKRYWWRVRKCDEEEFLSKVKRGDPVLVHTKKGDAVAYVKSIKALYVPPKSGIKTVIKF